MPRTTNFGGGGVEGFEKGGLEGGGFLLEGLGIGGFLVEEGPTNCERKSDDIEGTGLEGRGSGQGERGFCIDFGIVFNVHFDAIRMWVIEFLTKIMNTF